MTTENPIIPWKGATFQQLSAGVRFNKITDSTSVNNLFLPNPLKTYRREIASVVLNCTNSRSSIRIDDYDRPGGVLNTEYNSTRTGLVNTGDLTYEKNVCEHPSTTSYCGALLSPADNARRRVRSSGMIKKQSANDNYYTSTKQYLNSRNISYDQNLYFHVKYGDSTVKPGTKAALTNTYQSNGINKCDPVVLASGTSFKYYWVDDISYNVTVPAGNYDITSFNQLLQNTMSANFHYYTLQGSKVFLLSIGYDNLTDRVIISSIANTATNFPLTTYANPVTSPPPLWQNYYGQIPAILIENSVVSNLLGFAVSANSYPPPANRVSTVNVSASGSFLPGLRPKNVPIYYKPSNPQFGVQGAVSSSDRLLRKKYDTITTVGSSFRTAFGAQTANALAYGSPAYGYTIKERMGYPMKKTPTFSQYSSEMKQCPVRKFVNAI
jgi:hypothetical protein